MATKIDPSTPLSVENFADLTRSQVLIRVLIQGSEQDPEIRINLYTSDRDERGWRACYHSYRNDDHYIASYLELNHYDQHSISGMFRELEDAIPGWLSSSRQLIICRREEDQKDRVVGMLSAHLFFRLVMDFGGIKALLVKERARGGTVQTGVKALMERLEGFLNDGLRLLEQSGIHMMFLG